MADIANPMAGISIALYVVGGLGSLLALPGIISPEKHMKTFLPDSLPSDEKSMALLTLFHFTGMGASPLQFASLMLVAGYACPCKPAAYMFILGFAIRIGLGLYFAYGAPAQYMGLSQKMVMVQVGVVGAFILILIAGVVFGTSSPEYLAYSENMEASAMVKFADAPFLGWTLVGVSGFFVLANAPACFAPSMAMESYFKPGALPTDKYFLGKFTEYMKLNAAFWTLTSFYGLALCFMALDFTVVGPAVVFWNFFYHGLFVYNINASEYYGFAKPPMLFFLSLITLSNGAFLMGLADAYL